MNDPYQQYPRQIPVTASSNGQTPPHPYHIDDARGDASSSGATVEKGIETRASKDFNIYGDAGIVAASIGTLITESRKKDLLEGSIRRVHEILDSPFEMNSDWSQKWEEAHDPITHSLAAPVLIIVAPRSIGSTTFALRLLAKSANSTTSILKLDPDWGAPSCGRLPLEKNHGFQLDLKDPEHDRVNSDFLDALSGHADHLRSCHSHLVLTVAQELWVDDRLPPRRGVHVLHLQKAPDAQALVEAHLESHGHAALASSLRTFTKACDSLKGLNAVKAARAARTIVAAWEEHQNLLHSSPRSGAKLETESPNLEVRVTAALTDWRNELDGLFGDAPAVHNPKSSLTVDDRCLLVALAVRQSAPMSQVARIADRLMRRLGEAPVAHGQTGIPTLHAAFAGRGTRRRLHDVQATVDGQDNVIFERPTYGQAIIEYVWDNYEFLREPLLAWLVETSTDNGDAKKRAVETLSYLAVRHGSIDYLSTLGKSAASAPDVFASVMESAVRDEHIGPLAWKTLYRWAGSDTYTEPVILLCQRVLQDPMSAGAEKRAMVRLRRVAHRSTTDVTRETVLKAFDELAQQDCGIARLVTEVRGWQQKRTSARAGSLAFLALMTVPDNETSSDLPWLVRSASTTEIDVQGAVHDLLVDPQSNDTVILRLVDWISSSSSNEDTYSQLRDTLLPALRRHDMFKAGMTLMRHLEGVCTACGSSAAEDFYQHLVDSRLQPTFPLPKEHESEAE
ncbi:hypothetical protein [Streptomyces sp. NPDC005438]|uniref:hypothetical protein n=1 Tax=Streptomyces sp. NPDC005438 TaxID=3156880 RepID=UPI0033A6A2B6